MLRIYIHKKIISRSRYFLDILEILFEEKRKRDFREIFRVALRGFEGDKERGLIHCLCT